MILFKLESLGVLVELREHLGLSLGWSSCSLLAIVFFNFIQSENFVPGISFLVCFLEVESLRHDLGHGVVIVLSLLDVRTNDFQLVVFLQTSLEHVVLGPLDGHGVVGLIGGDPQCESADDSLMESATVHGQFPVRSLQLAFSFRMKHQKWDRGEQSLRHELRETFSEFPTSQHGHGIPVNGFVMSKQVALLAVLVQMWAAQSTVSRVDLSIVRIETDWLLVDWTSREVMLFITTGGAPGSNQILSAADLDLSVSDKGDLDLIFRKESVVDSLSGFFQIDPEVGLS